MNQTEGSNTPVESRPPDHGPNRRDFVKRVLGATLAAGATLALGLTLYDPVGPQAEDDSSTQNRVLDFSRADSIGSKIAIVRGPERGGLDRAGALSKALEALGGVGRFIQKGDRVLVKVNAAFASPPILGATTHPDLLAAIAGLCLQAGAVEVRVTDNPINDPQSCFQLSGLAEAARKAGAKLILPRSSQFVRYNLPSGRLIRNIPVMLGPFQGVTKVIAAAPIKDHHRAGASMILKNWYGLLGGQRSVFHQNINGLITELAMMVKPTLAILDGTTTMITNGPTGGSLNDLKATNTLIVSTDPVAADAAGLELLGRQLAEVPYILQAQAAGAGWAEIEKLKPLRLTLGA